MFKRFLQHIKAPLAAFVGKLLAGTVKFKDFLKFLKEHATSFLKQSVVKAALKKFLGSAMAGGIKGFIITFIVEELFETIAEPIIKLSFRKLGYVYDRVGGEIKVTKLRQARQDGDRDEVDDLLDNV